MGREEGIPGKEGLNRQCLGGGELEHATERSDILAGENCVFRGRGLVSDFSRVPPKRPWKRHANSRHARAGPYR
jgi:hypothetical protein